MRTYSCTAEAKKPAHDEHHATRDLFVYFRQAPKAAGFLFSLSRDFSHFFNSCTAAAEHACPLHRWWQGVKLVRVWITAYCSAWLCSVLHGSAAIDLCKDICGRRRVRAKAAKVRVVSRVPMRVYDWISHRLQLCQILKLKRLFSNVWPSQIP